ncbi:MAG: outer membrane lipoprotein-sorting protein [Desulfatitalea sp.]|nr:outer membrane lipoprotein-sorting protein [Desulfatitalea sp.]NNK01763.1 outer membrane lipoprotein-sorting protein [Desulfatitalea sp.]
MFSMPICAWSTDGNAVAQKVYDRDDGKDSYARLKMLLIDKKGHKRLRTLITAVKDYGTLSKSYTRFYTPSAIDGTTFLTWEVHDSDNDQFLYLPALRRVRRVVSRQKKNRFVNTDFTFEDLERRKVSLDSHRILKVEAYSGYSCWVLESIPKEKESSQYGKRVSWIAKDLHMALRIDFYDSRGNLVKRMLNRNLKKIDGIWTAMDSEMQDLKRRSRTILRITQVKYNKGIPDHIFSKEYMRHGK